MEPNSVDACALICIRRCCAASSGRSFGASAFASPLRSPTSICVGISSAILAQRQNGSSFGKKRSHSSASFGKSGKLCRCQCSMASWYGFGSVRTSSLTALAYRVFACHWSYRSPERTCSGLGSDLGGGLFWLYLWGLRSCVGRRGAFSVIDRRRQELPRETDQLFVVEWLSQIVTGADLLRKRLEVRSCAHRDDRCSILGAHASSVLLRKADRQLSLGDIDVKDDEIGLERGGRPDGVITVYSCLRVESGVDHQAGYELAYVGVILDDQDTLSTHHAER